MHPANRKSYKVSGSHFVPHKQQLASQDPDVQTPSINMGISTLKNSEIEAAQNRLEFARKTLGADPPKSREIVAQDGGPQSDLLRWTKKYGVSLDYILAGDIAPLIIQASKWRKSAA